MDKIKVPNGSQVNMESTFDNVQTKAFSNLTKRVAQVIGSYGLNVTVTNGVLSGEFLPTLISSNGLVSVAGGNGLTTNGNYFSISSSLTTTNLTIQNPNNGYGIVLTYEEVGSSPVKAVNAFVFDALGSQSLNRNTVFSDGVTLSLVEFPTANSLATFKSSLTSEQVLIGVVWNSSGSWDGGTAQTSISSYPTTSYSTYRVADLREDEQMLFSSNLLSDSTVLFKDRPSTGTNAFSQDIEFSADLDISGTQTFSSGIDYVITPSSNIVTFDSSTGEHIRLYQENGESRTRVSYAYLDDIKVNTGTVGSPIWSDIKTIGVTPNTPTNLRIYDIYPTEDPNERKGYIEVKWNWDELNVTGKTTSTVTISNRSYTNETVSFSAQDLSTNLIGKLIYFPTSTNSYEITSVVDNGNDTYTITVDGDPSSETHPSGNGMRIIDADVETYILIFTANAQQGRAAKEQVYLSLDGFSYTKDPVFVQKLELGRTWNCTIQSVNNDAFSDRITMPGGSYDPDHAQGGQKTVSYTSPFLMELPDLSTDGSVSLIATTQGFDVNISGYDGGSNQTRAHEYEIIYSSMTTITEGVMDSLPLPSDVERVVSSAALIHIPASRPTRYSVGVRPLQNKQAVRPAVIQEVASGGGGVAPTNQVLFTDQIDIKTRKFKIISTDYIEAGNVLTYVPYSLVKDQFELPEKKEVIGRQVAFPSQGPNLADPSSNVSFEPSTHGGGTTLTPSFVAGSAPNPSHVIFTLNANTGNTTRANDESTWAYITPTAAETVQPGEIITLKSTIAMHNWGDSKVSGVIVISGTTTELARFEATQDAYYYPDPDGKFTGNYVATWENNTGAAVDVKYEIRGWANMKGLTSYDNLNMIHVFNDFYASDLQYGKITGGTYATQPVNFGNTPEPLSFKKDDAVTESSTHKTVTSFDITNYYSDIAYRFRFRSDLPGGVGIGDEFYLGVSPQGRFITTETLDVDFEITLIQFQPATVSGASGERPAILRVYPNNSPGSATTVEVDGGTDNLITSETRLPIRSQGGSRTFTVDAYDASASPNNTAELSGRITIVGRPIIVDTLT